MRTTDASPKRFAILSALMPGPRTPKDVMELVNWSTPHSDFKTVQDALLRLGLITKRPIAGGRVQLEITAAGRQTWREAADLYLHLIEVAKAPADEAAASLPTVPAKQWGRRRLPTPDEYQALRLACKLYELLAWDVLRATTLTLEPVFALDVEDVDLQASRLTIRRQGGRSQRVAIDAPLRHALAAAIGDRTDGPALLWEGDLTRSPRRHRPDSRRWTMYRWCHAWEDIKERAGVPSGVIPRPNPSGNKQPNISQENLPG